jgi:Cu/Ag efflux pump CusA
MKKFQIMFAICAGIAGGILLAQTEADLPNIMKGVAATGKDAKAGVAAKDKAAVVAAAKAYESAFKQVETVFTKRGTKDAADMAKANHTAATAAIAAANAGDFDKAGASLNTIQGSCAGCHGAHRDGPKGGPYTVK